MGTNSLTSIASGIIRVSHPNQYFTALSGDFVPRTSLGAPVDNSSNLGTSTYRWLAANAVKYNVGASADLLSIEGSSTDMLFKRAGSEKFRVTSTGTTTTGINQRTFVGWDGFSATTTASTTVSSITTSNTTAISYSVTLNGGPVAVEFDGDGSGDKGVIAVMGGLLAVGNVRIALRINGSNVAFKTYSYSIAGATSVANSYGISPTFIYNPGLTGAQTFSVFLEATLTSAAGGSPFMGIYLTSARMRVRELL